MQITQGEAPADRIDLALGHPSPSLLPLDLMRRATGHRLDQDDPRILQYGLEQGSGPFRRELAAFLTRRYGIPADPEGLFVTGGVSQALDLLCTLFTRPGDRVFVEEPTYFLALSIFADHRLEPVSLPVDEQGLSIEALEAELRRGAKPVFVYTVPTHQNPSGVTLSAGRRAALVELSREHGFTIVADEVYHLLSYAEAPPAPFAAFAAGGTVFSLGSFSKILAPGLRLGWIQAAPERLRSLAVCGMLDSGGGLAPFTSALVQSALELGLADEHLDRLRSVYRERLETMCSALDRYLGGRLRYRKPAGGYFLWGGLQPEQDTERLLEWAHRHAVSYLPGTRASARDGLRHCLRLSFARYESDQIEEGVRRLARALDAAGAPR